MDQSEMQNTFSENGKCINIIDGFKFIFRKKLVFNKELYDKNMKNFFKSRWKWQNNIELK